MSKHIVELSVTRMIRVADDLKEIHGTEDIEFAIELGGVSKMCLCLVFTWILTSWVDVIDDRFEDRKSGV